MRTFQIICAFLLIFRWCPIYSQADIAQDINNRLLNSIYPPLPNQVKFTKSFCEILGMLDEYGGRYVLSFVAPLDDRVESFYSTKKDNKSAEHFRTLIESYEKEIGTSLRVKIKAHNGFYSKSLNSLINCLYISNYNPFDLYTLNRKYILCLPEDLKYAYLKGVYYRFGSGNEISIPNGIQKLVTVAFVMESLGVRNIQIYSSGPNTLPTDFILTFEWTPNLKNKIDYIDSESRLISYPERRYIDYKNY